MDPSLTSHKSGGIVCKRGDKEFWYFHKEFSEVSLRSLHVIARLARVPQVEIEPCSASAASSSVMIAKISVIARHRCTGESKVGDGGDGGISICMR